MKRDCEKGREQEIDLSKLLHIVDNYYFGADERQYILYCLKTRTKKSDNSQYKAFETVGYYNNIVHMLRACAVRSNRTAVNSGEFNRLEDCIKHLVEKYDECISVMNKIV